LIIYSNAPNNIKDISKLELQKSAILAELD